MLSSLPSSDWTARAGETAALAAFRLAPSPLASATQMTRQSTLILASLLPLAIVEDLRPTWKAGESVCPSLPGFVTADLFPIRSPLIVADYLSNLVKGRSYAEIGTRNGDVMGCVSQFAKSVTAIEMDPGYCKKLRARGFGVACQRLEQIPMEDFPVADVYYWWPSDAMGQNELWLRIVSRALRFRQAKASIFIGFDAHWQPDLQVLPTLLSKYNGTVERLFFDEGGKVTGHAKDSATYQRAENKLEVSIAHPFYNRPATGASSWWPNLRSGLTSADARDAVLTSRVQQMYRQGKGKGKGGGGGAFPSNY